MEKTVCKGQFFYVDKMYTMFNKRLTKPGVIPDTQKRNVIFWNLAAPLLHLGGALDLQHRAIQIAGKGEKQITDDTGEDKSNRPEPPTGGGLTGASDVTLDFRCGGRFSGFRGRFFGRARAARGFFGS